MTRRRITPEEHNAERDSAITLGYCRDRRRWQKWAVSGIAGLITVFVTVSFAAWRVGYAAQEKTGEVATRVSVMETTQQSVNESLKRIEAQQRDIRLLLDEILKNGKKGS